MTDAQSKDYRTALAQVKDQHYFSALPARYGMSREQYCRWRLEQGEKCAICDATKSAGRHARLQVDHDHVTGSVRGLLCRGCNTALGAMKDDARLLRRAADYLENCRT